MDAESISADSKVEPDEEHLTTDGFRRWIRPAVVISAIILLGLINPRAAAYSTGSLLSLVIIWFIIKAYKPSWTAGWSGAWLFIFGLVSGLFLGMSYGTSAQNPVGIGVAMATIIVVPAYIVWNFYESVVPEREPVE